MPTFSRKRFTGFSAPRNLSAASSKRAFTLLELVVVVVVISVLAALALPTFQSVKNQVVDSNSQTTLAALIREASALALFRGDNTFTPTDFIQATADLPAGGVGVNAAVGWTVFTEPTGEADSVNLIHLKLANTPTGQTAALATLTPTGNCAMALTTGVSSPPTTWAQPVTDLSPCSGVVALAGPSNPDFLAPPSNFTVTPGDHLLTVSFTPAPLAVSTVVSRFETDAGPLAETTTVVNADCDETCTLEFGGILPAKAYKITAASQAGEVSSDPVETIGVPTGDMAWVAANTNQTFTSHPFADWETGLTLYASLTGNPAVDYVEYAFPVVETSVFDLPHEIPKVRNTSKDLHRYYQWALDMMRFEDVWCASDGSDSGIALIDSHIADSADFGSQMVSAPDSHPASTDPDGSSHGVATASIIISQPNEVGIVGAAPGTILVPYAAPDEGGLNPVKIREAWAAANELAFVDVINMSFGTSAASDVWSWMKDKLPLVDPPDDPYINLAEDSADEDKIMVASAGQDDTGELKYPAGLDAIISVGAVNSNGSVMAKTNFGDHLDLSAPGGDGPEIPDPNGNLLGIMAVASPDGDPISTGGTSFSAPYISSLAAIIRSLHPDMSRVDVFNAMKDGARDVHTSGWDSRTGWGVPDAVDVLASLGDVPATGCPGEVKDAFNGSVASNAIPSGGRATLSKDGSVTVMETNRTNLTTLDTTNDTDILLLDTTLATDIEPGVYTLVTNGENGALEQGRAPAISADGTKVSYTDGAGDNLYVYDRETNTTTHVFGYVFGISSGFLSGDGSKVAFSTTGVPPGYEGIDTNYWNDVYVYDFDTATFTRASTTSAGGQGSTSTGHDCGVHKMAEGGDHVLFSCGFTKPSLMTPDSNGAVADLYVKELSTGQLWRANESEDGTQSAMPGAHSDISPSGRYVTFSSLGDDLVPNDTNNASDSFLKDLSTGEITRITGPNDQEFATGSSHPSISSTNFNLIAFSTSDSIDEDDTEFADVYVKDLSTGRFTWVSSRTNQTYPFPNSGIYDVQYSADRVLFRIRHYSIYFTFYRDM